MALNAIIHRTESSWIQQLATTPCTTLAKSLYAGRQQLLLSARRHDTVNDRPITIVCISDTHNTQPQLPQGDVLIHAGDLTQNGTAEELQDQLDWLDQQPHEHKIVIAGNHDRVLDPAYVKNQEHVASTRRLLRWKSIIYLEKSASTVALSNGRRLTFYGHPCTKRHGNWAFQYDKGVDVFSGQVPLDTDILITHSPPNSHLDVADWGDPFLLQELWRVRPRLHVFGHIHAGAGRDVLVYDRFGMLYDQVCGGSAGVLAVLQMTLLLLLMLVGISSSTARTTLVNASVVGGVLDQHRRTVQVVSL